MPCLSARRLFTSHALWALALALAGPLAAQAEDKVLTLALARSAITPGEETFTYAVPKQLGWFKREGLHGQPAEDQRLHRRAAGRGQRQRRHRLRVVAEHRRRRSTRACR